MGTFSAFMGVREVEWAYHASRGDLPSIRKHGLVPSVNEGLVDEYVARGEDPETIPEMLYFDETPEGLDEYGDLLLRFPFPKDFEDATYKWGTEGLITFKTVPPKVIEYYDAPADEYDEDVDLWKPVVPRRGRRR